MYKRMTTQIAMTRNSNGKAKDEPFFWGASKPCSIPKEKDHLDHGRPLVVIEASDPDDSVVLVVFPDRIVARDKDGNDAVLVREDQA